MALSKAAYTTRINIFVLKVLRQRIFERGHCIMGFSPRWFYRLCHKASSERLFLDHEDINRHNRLIKSFLCNKYLWQRSCRFTARVNPKQAPTESALMLINKTNSLRY